MNVFHFKYIVTIFSADVKQGHDIKARVTQAFTPCDKLRHVLDVTEFSTDLKIRLYKVVIYSILTYGCETRRLTPPVMWELNGANSNMLSRFTHKTIPQKTRVNSCSFDLVRSIRIRRFKWLDHILRTDPDHITFQVIEEQKRLGLPVNILMDAPQHNTLGYFVTLTKDSANWRSLIENIQ